MLKSEKNNKKRLTGYWQNDEKNENRNKKEEQIDQKATFFHKVKTNGYLTIFYILV